MHAELIYRLMEIDSSGNPVVDSEVGKILMKDRGLPPIGSLLFLGQSRKEMDLAEAQRSLSLAEDSPTQPRCYDVVNILNYAQARPHVPLDSIAQDLAQITGQEQPLAREDERDMRREAEIEKLTGTQFFHSFPLVVVKRRTHYIPPYALTKLMSP